MPWRRASARGGAASERGEELPVRQPGGAIVVGQLTDPLLRLYAFGDVLRDAIDTDALSAFVDNGRGLLEHRARRAVQTHDLEFEPVGRAFTQQAFAGLSHALAVLLRHMGQELLRAAVRNGFDFGIGAEQPRHFGRADDPTVARNSQLPMPARRCARARLSRLRRIASAVRLARSE